MLKVVKLEFGFNGKRDFFSWVMYKFRFLVMGGEGIRVLVLVCDEI